jgi:hypothetical protein
MLDKLLGDERSAVPADADEAAGMALARSTISGIFAR